ncbi:MAG: molybdenum cofactor guanylyltransferase [Clostridia bacterium]|nr:molybdenum cofactor guanylyltransferase [Clostridia bacterium]
MAGAIILSGGRNTRMGTNKAFLQISRVTFVERIINELKKAVEEIIVVTNDPDAYAHLSARTVTDIIPHKGPLSGIHAGLVNSGHYYNLVVACDMPFFNGKLGRLMLDLAEGYDAVVPQVGDYLEPLYAVYSKNCIKPIEDSLTQDIRKVTSLLPQIKVRYLGSDVVGRFLSGQNAFYNVNTPDDLDLAKKIAGEEGYEQ